MKSLIAVLFLSVPALALSVPDGAVLCGPGQIAYEGVCAADPRPAVVAIDYVKPSDEKPPENKMPSYQRDGIHVDEAKAGVEESTSVAHDYESERNEK